jgi:hypothetical protein
MGPVVLRQDRPFREGQRFARVPDPEAKAEAGAGVWVEDSEGYRRAGFVVEIVMKRIEVPRPRLLAFLSPKTDFERKAKVQFSRTER